MIKKLLYKIAAWLRGESYIQQFIDRSLKTRLEQVYTGCKLYLSYNFANRQQFYMYLIGIGLDVLEKMYIEEKKKDDISTNKDIID